MGLGMAQPDRPLADRLLDDLSRGSRDAAYAATLGAAQSYGSDVYDDRTVLRFERRTAGNRSGYTYAAIKAAGAWYLSNGTGIGSRAMTWHELVVFWVTSPTPVTRVEVLTGVDWIGPAALETLTREADAGVETVVRRTEAQCGDTVLVRGEVQWGVGVDNPRENVLQVRIDSAKGTLANDDGVWPQLGDLHWQFDGEPQ